MLNCMTQHPRKSINELLSMSSAEVRAYLQSLSRSEQKTISEELYRAHLSLDMQKVERLPGQTR